MLSVTHSERQKHAKKAEEIAEDVRAEDIGGTRALPAIRKSVRCFDGMLEICRRCPNIPW